MNTVQPIRSKETLEFMKVYLMRIDYKYFIMFTLGINTGLRISDLLELKVKDVTGSYIDIRAGKTNKENLFMINDQLKKLLNPYIQGMPEDKYLFESNKANNKPMTLKQHALYLQKKKHRFHEVAALLQSIHDQTQIPLEELVSYKTLQVMQLKVNEEVTRKIIKRYKTLAPEEHFFKLRPGMKKPIERVQAYKVINQVAKELKLEKIGTHTIRKTFGYWHYKQFKDVAILMCIFNHSSPSITLDYIGINQEEKDNNISEFHL